MLNKYARVDEEWMSHLLILRPTGLFKDAILNHLFAELHIGGAARVEVIARLVRDEYIFRVAEDAAGQRRPYHIFGRLLPQLLDQRSMNQRAAKRYCFTRSEEQTSELQS